MRFCFGTPMSPGIMNAADRLARRRATRRILITMTDGECNYKSQGMIVANDYARARGVETVGIGMMIDLNGKGFDVTATVADVKTLATTTLATLAKALS